MRLGELPVTDVRGPLTAQRGRLADLLAWLTGAQWAAPTAAPQWRVKDLALHLLDVDLSWLARPLSPRLITDLLRWSGVSSRFAASSSRAGGGVCVGRSAGRRWRAQVSAEKVDLSAP